MDISIGIVLTFFLISLFFTLVRGPQLSGKTIFFLRAFFPSWRFFEDLGQLPLLSYRTSLDGVHFGPWQNALQKLTRSPFDFIFFPEGNLHHAYGNHLQHLMDEISDEKAEHKISSLTVYKLTKNIVQYELKKNENSDGPLFFQFKLSLSSGDAKGDSPLNAITDILISPVYEA